MRFTAAAPIRTARLVLRPLVESDLDDVSAYQGDPEVVRYLPWPVRDREASRQHLLMRSALTSIEAEGDGAALAIERDGRVIGDLSIFLRSVEHRSIELGWVLHPDARGAGYATEAVDAILALVFDELYYHRVIARVDPRNEASARLAARLGMRHEARLIEDALIKNEWVSTDIWAILQSEWRQRRGARIVGA